MQEPPQWRPQPQPGEGADSRLLQAANAFLQPHFSSSLVWTRPHRRFSAEWSDERITRFLQWCTALQARFWQGHPLGGTSKYSKVTMACVSKRRWQHWAEAALWNAKDYSGYSSLHFLTANDPVFVFTDGSLFFFYLFLRNQGKGRK